MFNLLSDLSTTATSPGFPMASFSSTVGLVFKRPSSIGELPEEGQIACLEGPTVRTFKHPVQKILRAAYWKYVADVITPTDSSNTQLKNKRFWTLFKHSRTGSMGIPSLGKTRSNCA